MTYATLANHRQPHLDCLAYLSQLVLYQINFQQAPAAGIDTPEQHELAFLPDVLSGPLNGNKQTYYDLSTMLMKVAATMPDTLVKTKVCCCHTVVVQRVVP